MSSLHDMRSPHDQEPSERHETLILRRPLGLSRNPYPEEARQGRLETLTLRRPVRAVSKERGFDGEEAMNVLRLSRLAPQGEGI